MLHSLHMTCFTCYNIIDIELLLHSTSTTRRKTYNITLTQTTSSSVIDPQQQQSSQHDNKAEDLLKEEEQLRLMLKQQGEIDRLKAQLSNTTNSSNTNVLHIPDPDQMALSLKTNVSNDTPSTPKHLPALSQSISLAIFLAHSVDNYLDKEYYTNHYIIAIPLTFLADPCFYFLNN